MKKLLKLIEFYFYINIKINNYRSLFTEKTD